jgi:glycosysltransferase
VLNQIVEILKKSNVFLTGRGGVGKSYLTQAVIKYYKSELKNVVVLGSTGISAVSVGGVSVHSFFKFGICSNINELRGFDRKQRSNLSKLKTILDSCDLIVIDEISMISSDLMDMIYYRLMNSKFVGRVLLVGDFYQLPPVQKSDESRSNSLFKFLYAFNSSAWREFALTNIELVVSKRTKDEKFYEILSLLRIGNLSDEVVKYLENLRIKGLVVDDNVSVLFGRNNEVNLLNNKMLFALKTPLESSNAIVEIFDENLHESTLERWIANLAVPEILNMKIGAKIMFTANKWGEYYNGESGEIVQILKENGDISSVIIKKSNNEILEIQKVRFDLSEFVLEGENIEQQIKASFFQFPFKLAYAITIHKSQGMSISNLICDLNHIFANGQLYVALSRAIDPNGLRIFYDKSKPFIDYLRSVVKIDEEVSKFYLENKFENIKEDL